LQCPGSPITTATAGNFATALGSVHGLRASIHGGVRKALCAKAACVRKLQLLKESDNAFLLGHYPRCVHRWAVLLFLNSGFRPLGEGVTLPLLRGRTRRIWQSELNARYKGAYSRFCVCCRVPCDLWCDLAACFWHFWHFENFVSSITYVFSV